MKRRIARAALLLIGCAAVLFGVIGADVSGMQWAYVTSLQSVDGSDVVAGATRLYSSDASVTFDLSTYADGTSPDTIDIKSTGGGGGGAPTDATYLTNTANGTLSAEVVVSALTGNLTIKGDAASSRTITLGQQVANDDQVNFDTPIGNVHVDGVDVVSISASQTLTNKTIDMDNNTINDIDSTNVSAGGLSLTDINQSNAADGEVMKWSTSDAQWVPGTDSGAGSPLTTKGDIFTYDTGDQRLAVGTNGQVLKANSATATGLEWADESGGGGATKCSVVGVGMTYRDGSTEGIPNVTYDGTYAFAIAVFAAEMDGGYKATQRWYMDGTPTADEIHGRFGITITTFPGETIGETFACDFTANDTIRVHMRGHTQGAADSLSFRGFAWSFNNSDNSSLYDNHDLGNTSARPVFLSGFPGADSTLVEYDLSTDNTFSTVTFDIMELTAGNVATGDEYLSFLVYEDDAITTAGRWYLTSVFFEFIEGD